MLQNRAFWKALHSLTHPISLIAIVVLLLNDHWLRYVYPSWVFGKLGDFTWLIFAPFLVALLLAWIVPQRMKTQPNWVGWMSIGLVGVWFALAKTHPAVHSFSLDVLKFISGWQPTLLMDSSDLITLTALPISVWIWNQADDQPKNVKAWASVALGLGVLATAATSPGPSSWGITCVFAKNDTLYALTNEQYRQTSFTTIDSGYHWEEIQSNTLPTDYWELCHHKQGLWRGTNTSIKLPNTQLRITSGESIEASIDGGTSWSTEFDLSVTIQDVRIRAIEQRAGREIGSVIYDPGPLDVLYDKQSGNVLFAMGHNGVLVRSSASEYTWARLGPYYFEAFTDAGKITSILQRQELWISISIFFSHLPQYRYGIMVN